MAGAAHLNRATIEATQLARLRELVAALSPANPFQTVKLSGLTQPLYTLADFTRHVPFTTKAELVADQKAFPPYGTNLTYPVAQYSRLHQTSGTTGSPMRWLDTPETWHALIDCWAEVYHAAGVTAADRIFFAFSFGPFLGFWLAFDAAQKIGSLCLPGGGLSSPARLQMLLDNGATVLCCTPTYALRLAEVAASERIDLTRSRIKTIIVAGEPGGSIPIIRQRLEAAWPGARVFDHHGMTEVGPVTYECPAQTGILHVIESAFLAEIVNPQTGEPIPAGEKGELILTTLVRTGSPLLRYRTGDLVCAAKDAVCACGRHELALAGGILGRVDDMVVVRGVNVYPSAVEETLRRFPEIAEYQVVLTTANSLNELNVKIEPAEHCADVDSLLRRVENAFQTNFSLRVPVVAVNTGSLPRFEMKAKRWIKY